jgi:hypothetical protein
MVQNYYEVKFILFWGNPGNHQADTRSSRTLVVESSWRSIKGHNFQWSQVAIALISAWLNPPPSQTPLEYGWSSICPSDLIFRDPVQNAQVPQSLDLLESEGMTILVLSPL